jgi:hypothetical protein
MVFAERNNRIISVFLIAALIMCLFCTHKVADVSGAMSFLGMGASFERVSSVIGDIEAIKQSDSSGAQAAFVRKGKGNNVIRVRRNPNNMFYEVVAYIGVLSLLLLFSTVSEPFSQAQKITIGYIHNKDGCK